MGKRNNRNRRAEQMREIQELLTENAEKFAYLTFKKYKKWAKKEGIPFDDKNDKRNSYYNYLTELLCPDVIEWMLRFGYRNNDAEIVKLRNKVYTKLIDEPKYIKWLTKMVESFQDKKKKKKRSMGIYGFENIELLPMLLRDLTIAIDNKNKMELANNPNAEIIDVENLIVLSKTLLERRMKRLEKHGIPENVAFIVLSIIPTPDVIQYSANYRIGELFRALYEVSKGTAVPFGDIIKYLFEKDEDWYCIAILFALLERKEKFGSLTDNQKKLYLSINNWVFTTLESANEAFISKILEGYIKSRKRDDAQGKDGNRRYALSSLSEKEYPRITSVMKRMMLQDESVKKYF